LPLPLIREAEDPSIYWQNLHWDHCERRIFKIMTFFFFVLTISLGGISFLYALNVEQRFDVFDLKTFGYPVLIMVLNMISGELVKILSVKENHVSHLDLNKSRINKLYLVYMLNSLIVPTAIGVLMTKD
jgi:hypothetical protein